MFPIIFSYFLSPYKASLSDSHKQGVHFLAALTSLGWNPLTSFSFETVCRIFLVDDAIMVLEHKTSLNTRNGPQKSKLLGKLHHHEDQDKRCSGR